MMKYISIIYYVKPRMREKEKGDSRQINVKYFQKNIYIYIQESQTFPGRGKSQMFTVIHAY